VLQIGDNMPRGKVCERRANTKLKRLTVRLEKAYKNKTNPNKSTFSGVAVHKIRHLGQLFATLGTTHSYTDDRISHHRRQSPLSRCFS